MPQESGKPQISLALFNELTGVQANEVAPDAVIRLPVGATEQHGPHLPVGTDTFAVEHISREAARIAAEEIPVVVAPTLPFGCSPHHIPFGGSMSLGTDPSYRVPFDPTELRGQCGWKPCVTRGPPCHGRRERMTITARSGG